MICAYRIKERYQRNHALCRDEYVWSLDYGLGETVINLESHYRMSYAVYDNNPYGASELQRKLDEMYTAFLKTLRDTGATDFYIVKHGDVQTFSISQPTSVKLYKGA